jgi:hypothetical protein
MATWAWARTYAREHRLGDFVPRVALPGSWVGARRARKDVAKLVEVGLFLEVNDGWRIVVLRNPRRPRSDANRAFIAGELRVVPANAVSDYERESAITQALGAVAEAFKARRAGCDCAPCQQVEALRSALLETCKRCRFTASRAELDGLAAKRGALIDRALQHDSGACVRRPSRRLP